MTTILKIPHVTTAKLLRVLQHLSPIVERDGVLWKIKLPDLRCQAFTWDPTFTEPMQGLRVATTIRTLHAYGAPCFFKPSIAEVIAQLPQGLANWPGDLWSLVAFSVQGPRDMADMDLAALNAGFHVATTTLWRRGA